MKYIDKNQPKTTGTGVVGIYCNINCFVIDGSGTGTGTGPAICIIIAGAMTWNLTCAGGPSNMAGLPAHLLNKEYDIAGKFTGVNIPVPGIT